MKKDYRGLSQVAAGNSGFPRVLPVLRQGASQGASEKSGILWGGGRFLGLHWVWCNGRGPHLQLRQEPQGSSPFQTPITGSLQTWDRRVRPLLGLRHGTVLASRGVHRVTSHLSSCIWNLRVFSRRCTGESLPLRVDFIHRVEFEEVSGHRLLIKRGPGNWGASECGTTHEATSGMSS